MICWFKQEECSHLMPAASLVYSESVIECLLHLPDCQADKR